MEKPYRVEFTCNEHAKRKPSTSTCDTIVLFSWCGCWRLSCDVFINSILSIIQVSLKYAFESKNDLFLILDLMTGGECTERVPYEVEYRCQYVAQTKVFLQWAWPKLDNPRYTTII